MCCTSELCHQSLTEEAFKPFRGIEAKSEDLIADLKMLSYTPKIILYISSSDFKYCKGGYIEGHFLRKD
ncbi:unnamed protein product [Larinioides sclopetarius]|uniref:Uncharacterized protein n=1 Tax=Larinioides sclopetarius TaxID=280406 RepID=A0AAV1Z6E1_9ARAC